MGVKDAKGMSLRYDEIAAFETLFRATFVRISTLFRGTFMRMFTLFRGTFLFGIFLGEEMFCFCGGYLGDFITLWVVYFFAKFNFL